MEFRHHSKLEKVQRGDRWKGIHRKSVELTAGNVSECVSALGAVGDRRTPIHFIHPLTLCGFSGARSKARRLGPINKLHSRIYRRERCVRAPLPLHFYVSVWCSGAALRDWVAGRLFADYTGLRHYMHVRTCFLIKSLVHQSRLFT